MTFYYRLPEIVELQNYLKANGWVTVGRGDRGDLLELRDNAVAVPRTWNNDPDLARSVVDRVAFAMDRSPGQVLASLLTPYSDGVEVRLRGDRLGYGSVSLGGGHEALKNSRRLLASAGTSAVRPVRSINRKYHKEAKDLAKSARLEHTKEGSFIFPIKVDFGLDEDQATIESYGIPVEPYARRTTRTLAQALGFTHRLTTDSFGPLDPAELDDAAVTGVTREVCLSVNDFMRDPEVEEVELSFTWGSSIRQPGELPTAVSFDRGHRPRLRQLIKQFSSPMQDTREQLVGTVLGIEHNSERTEFHFTLDAYHHARPAQVRIEVDGPTHERAIRWYEERATVVVSGKLSETVAGLRMAFPDSARAFVHDHLTE